MSAERSQGLFRRALGGGVVVAGCYAASQFVRLASNLILTRLLYPEAFGIMALVFVVLQGLQLFSDVGIGPAIMRSPRGDDPRFLNTAWTINVLRGAILWLLACALAWPVSRFYAVPELAWLVPVGALSLLIGGFWPTKIDTAHRHLLLVRVTLLELAGQVLGIGIMIAVALATGSIWALVAGSLATALINLLFSLLFLPGRGNRFEWDSEAARELVHFGKWIMISTACGFLLTQGDKIILGVWLSMTELGHYNIGWFLASFPALMAGVVVGRIMMPLYRDHPPGSSAAGDLKMQKLRLLLSLVTLSMLTVLALFGDPLAKLLYDARYADVGVIMTGVALAQMPLVLGMTYDQAALAAGDGRGFFLLQAARAGLQTTALLIGTWAGGLGGALAGLCCALILAHFCVILLAKRHRAWDRRHDLTAGGLAAVLMLTLVFLRWPGLVSLWR
ncbi:oligosaccharide flippase family protein [Pseudogemmobacter faecipullorum]|uniref:Oligosaccharide flippase family protein n=1 Tax=Pseudogemmobacter faecipullorum TaxID=2755041 RepID=A0ABS8CGR8_9RHOB|nr:oligosaccharide flippase family protein [Pseudogemmobacter faecipullorum]MCB5408588.1 oligosaccharide flippase family protein [Pseudogemmobacter faecipullorum]